MTSKNNDSFTGNDGFNYIKISDDLGYIRESPSDKDARLYYESYALEESMLASILGSNLTEPAMSFCVFSLKITQLDRMLNDFYDSVAKLCTQPNSMASMKKPKEEQIEMWADKKTGKVKSFSALSLGQKHHVLQMVSFITNEDKKMYKKIMTKLGELVQNRNEITHYFFNSKKSTNYKIELISNANKLCLEIYSKLDSLDHTFNSYVLRNVSLYYSQNKD